MGVHSLNSPAFLFVYILMHGGEEWIVVQLGSQNKRIERPVRPVFQDYLSVSCDYVHDNRRQEKKRFLSLSPEQFSIVYFTDTMDVSSQCPQGAYLRREIL